jgi:putative Mg2+ transporter-C (MgtC) family protein
VALGACFFTVISFQAGSGFSPAIIQAIAIGIGFIGAGVIFHQPAGIVGLTTAAGLWATAAIGIAVGAQLYSLATFTTFLALLVFSGFGLLEKKIFKQE